MKRDRESNKPLWIDLGLACLSCILVHVGVLLAEYSGNITIGCYFLLIGCFVVIPTKGVSPIVKTIILVGGIVYAFICFMKPLFEIGASL